MISETDDGVEGKKGASPIRLVTLEEKFKEGASVKVRDTLKEALEWAEDNRATDVLILVYTPGNDDPDNGGDVFDAGVTTDDHTLLAKLMIIQADLIDRIRFGDDDEEGDEDDD